LQNHNDPQLPLRLAEYPLYTFRLYGLFPEQYALHIGNAEMRMHRNWLALIFISGTRWRMFARWMKKHC
jgi:hypothetical protein